MTSLYSSEHGPTSGWWINLIVKEEITVAWSLWILWFAFWKWILQGEQRGRTIICMDSDACSRRYGLLWRGGISEWENCILLTSLKAGELVSMKVASKRDSLQDPKVWLKNRFGRLRDICTHGRKCVPHTSNRDGKRLLQKGRQDNKN